MGSFEVDWTRAGYSPVAELSEYGAEPLGSKETAYFLAIFDFLIMCFSLSCVSFCFPCLNSVLSTLYSNAIKCVHTYSICMHTHCACNSPVHMAWWYLNTMRIILDKPTHSFNNLLRSADWNVTLKSVPEAAFLVHGVNTIPGLLHCGHHSAI